MIAVHNPVGCSHLNSYQSHLAPRFCASLGAVLMKAAGSLVCDKAPARNSQPTQIPRSPLSRFTLIALAVAFAPSAWAANTVDTHTSPAGSLLTSGNWSAGLPGVANDAVFTATTGIRTLTAGNLTVGSFNVTASTGTFSIRNATSTATNSNLTLGGAGNLGNGVAGTAAADLLFAATGSTFNITGPNGSGGTGTLSLVLGQSGNFNAAGTIAITSVISDGGNGFSITKTGVGALSLGGANTYSGSTTISAGTLTVNGSLSGTSSVNINAGTLLLGTSNVINDSAAVKLGTAGVSGGTLKSGGFSEFAGAGNGTGAGLGALTLNESSNIDFGSGTSVLWFSGIGTFASGKTLTVDNWSGISATGGGTDQLRFTSDPSAVLSQISFTGFGGATEVFFANGGQSYYEIVPVPEPSTTALLGSFALLALVGFRERKRFTKA